MSLLGQTITGGNGRRFIPEQAHRAAAFLEANLPLRAFVTLTLPHGTSKLRLDTAFMEWMGKAQEQSRATLGWIKAYEAQPALHCHAVLVAAQPLDCDDARLLWNQVIGTRSRTAARVETYQPGIGGLAYVMKSLGRDNEDVQFSENLSAFLPRAARRFFGKTSAERRQIRRVLRQQSRP